MSTFGLKKRLSDAMPSIQNDIEPGLHFFSYFSMKTYVLGTH